MAALAEKKTKPRQIRKFLDRGVVIPTAHYSSSGKPLKAFRRNFCCEGG
jgi:hypothetical protein